jgi:PHP family Zn ribbon phosphoesterase
VKICGFCGAEGKDVVLGVFDRIKEIADYQEPIHPPHRPPYRYQIPLMFVPGMNDKTLKYLIELFGSEMAILNTVREEEIRTALPPDLARNIIDARAGRLKLSSGGGGHHGSVKKRDVTYDQLSLF